MRPVVPRPRGRLLAALFALPMLLAPAIAAAETQVTFGAAAHSKAEDNSAGDLALVVATNAAVGADLAVSYTLGGTATPGTDYTIGSGANYGARTGTFTVPSGTKAGIFVDALGITAVSDALQDNGETIVVTIVDGAGYDPGATATTTVTLFENTGDAAFEVSGAPVMGETLTVVRTVDDPDGNGVVQHYQWLRKSPDAQAWTRILGATQSEYAAPAIHVGQELLVAVTYVDDLGVTRTVHTPPIGPVVEYYAVSFSQAGYSAKEGIPVHAWVHIAPVRASATHVPISTTAITATGGGVDYQDYGATATIPAGWNRLPLSVNTVIDKVLDEGETFRLDIDGSSLPQGVKVGTHGSAVVTLLDPALAITGGDAVDEGQPAVFTLDMDHGPGGTWPYIDVRVAVPWGGRVMSRKVRREAQQTVLSFTATGDDLNVNGDWHYCAWVLPVTGYKTGDSGKPPKPAGSTYDGNPANCPSGATVLVRDDDDHPSEAEAPRVTSIERYYPDSARTITPSYLRWRLTFSEEVGNMNKADFQLTGTTARLSVEQAKNQYGKAIDGARIGGNWVADGTGSTWDVTARGGNLLDIKGTVTLSFADDQDIEDLDGNALADTTPTGTNDNHYVVNDPNAEAEPAASFASATSSSAEDAGTHKVMLNLAPAPSTGLTLSYTVDGTATAGSGKDFTIQDAGTLTVAAGATTAALPVGLHDDASVEDDETVVLTLTDGTGYTLGGTTAHTFTIADNDGSAGTPGVTVSTGALDLAEGGTAGSYTVVLAAAPTANVTVTATSGDAAKVKLHKQGGSPGASTMLTFTPTTWNQAQTITVTPEQDGDADDETVTVVHAVSQTGGYDGVTAASVTVAVDDDEAPAACVSAQLLSDVQGYAGETGNGSVHVERWSRVLAAFGESNSYSNNPMTGIEAQSYADKGWARWVSVVTALECLEGTTPPPPALPVISSADGAGITEGGDAVFTVSASPAPAADLTVSLTVADDTNSDFLAQSDEGVRTVTIAGGQTSATLTVTTEDDSTDEADGSVTAAVAGGTGYTVGTPSTGTVAVSDDDPAPTPVVGIAAGSAITEGGAARFTLTATPAPLGTLTVHVNVVDSGAFASTGESGARTVTIDTTGSATLDVATDNDNTDEPDGTLGATIATGQGYTPSGTHGSASIAVRDDDASTACVSDALLADVDNRIQASGTAAGVERWTRVKNALTGAGNAITLAEVREIYDRRTQNGWSTAQWDPVIEALECLEGTPPPPALPAISISAGAGVTEGGDAMFTVSASPAPTASLTVSLTVADDGTSDFLAQSDEGTRRVTIAGGQTSATLTLTTQDDSTDETDGSVTATISGGTGYTVGSPSTGTVAVSDDDPTPQGTPVVSIAAGADVAEGGHATFTLTAAPVPTASITVDVAVAQSGDFAASGQTGTRTVTIGTGGTATLTVATDDDTTDEADGSVTATVQAGAGYTAHDTEAAATVAVTDDEVPVVRVAGGAGVTEGTSASFTVTASPPPAAPLGVTLVIGQSGDFAASGETGTRTVTVATSGNATFSVATDDDGTDEAHGSVTATVQAGTGYTVAAAPNHAATVTVSDDDGASSGPTLSIADASFNENEGYGYFTVTLSEATDHDVRFAFATRDSTPVSATAGEDYVEVPRAWRIGRRVKAGETQTRFWVRLRNDNHDEGPETFEVEIFDAFLWRAGKVVLTITDSVAVGTIVNSDPMPAAWLARFGRTAAEQALDGIAGRLTAPRTAGVQGSLAGRPLTIGGGPGGFASGVPGAALGGADFPGAGPRTSPGASRPAPSATAGRSGWGTRAVNPTGDRFGDAGWGADAYGPGASRTLTLREALLGSHFTRTGAADPSGGNLALWGRAAQSRFDGRDGTFSLDGETTTATLGADYARGDWLLGLALMQSEGDGGYADRGTGPPLCTNAADEMDLAMVASLCNAAVAEGAGDVESSLTAAVPYAALDVSERLKLWGAFGYGSGDVTLKPRTGGVLESDIAWTMAAAGARGDLLGPLGEGGGISLAMVSDALWARTSSDRTNALSASDSDVTRLRLGLEGRWTHPLEGGGHFTPKLEVGLRHDGGDAETGFGVELGGGLAWSAPALGLNLDLSARTLVAHDDDLQDRGFAASLAFDPDPASERGASLRLSQTLGGRAQGGLDALFAGDPLEDRVGRGATGARRMVEAAWGVAAFGGRFTGSPYAGVGLATGSRDYTLGWRLTPATGANAPNLFFGARATRREHDAGPPEHIIGFEATARW